ncbi:hypothetical protein T439DRAFT_327125 [Meredithblackwellia eburnea MCA 4105]
MVTLSFSGRTPRCLTPSCRLTNTLSAGYSGGWDPAEPEQTSHREVQTHGMILRAEPIDSMMRPRLSCPRLTALRLLRNRANGARGQSFVSRLAFQIRTLFPVQDLLQPLCPYFNRKGQVNHAPFHLSTQRPQLSQVHTSFSRDETSRLPACGSPPAPRNEKAKVFSVEMKQ